MTFKNYTNNYFKILFISILFIVSFNVIMKSYYTNRPFMALLKKPSSIIIGTSTANFGLDPKHNNLVSDHYYSIPVGGVKNKLVWIKRFDSLNDLENVVLCLDFFEYNSYREVKNINSGSIDNLFLIILNLFKELFSIDSFIYSVKKYFHKTSEIVLENGHVWLKDYTAIHTFKAIKIDEIETHLPKPGKKFSIYSHNNYSKLIYLKEIINYCIHNNINLVMIIPPRHMAMTEIERTLGLNKDFENWKIELVDLINNFSNQQQPDLWDFSLMNEITTEKLPENKIANMNWFRDRLHFTENLGDYVLDVIFGNNDMESLPENFGVKIDTYNIDHHLSVNDSITQEFRNKNIIYLDRLRSNVKITLNSYMGYK
jgi:hypothetical protein